MITITTNTITTDELGLATFIKCHGYNGKIQPVNQQGKIWVGFNLSEEVARNLISAFNRGEGVNGGAKKFNEAFQSLKRLGSIASERQEAVTWKERN